MQDEVFTGEVVQVVLDDGVVCLRIRGKEPGRRQGEEAPVAHEMFMPPSGFLQLFSRVEEAVQHLVESGQIRYKEEEA